KTSNTHYSGPFFNGTIGMLPMGTWFIGTQIAKVASGESMSKNWGIVKFPHPDGVAAGTTAAQIAGLAVNENSNHKAEVLDFIE
ncbi:extracellular solute-binding protein, partial [Tritonibacter sp. SIMBA_163]|uniref:extracellular solute-binding protein n=1 Tax=Tritonibacter sp. SIMBA_163 TaxID=3080868 RepID=UPI00397FF4CC